MTVPESPTADPRPSDDYLRLWRSEWEVASTHGGLPVDLSNAVLVCNALLSERAAHLVTKARLDRLAVAARHVIVGRAIDTHPHEPNWTRDEVRLAEALAALADPEEPQ